MLAMHWKETAAVFILYYVLLFVGATIIMYIEARGLQDEAITFTNASKTLDGFLRSELELQLNSSYIDRILQLSQTVAEQRQKAKKTLWKREISWKTMYRWRYFTHTTLTTVGK